MKSQLQLRLYNGLFISICLLFSITNYAQTNLYSENFTGQNGKGKIGSNTNLFGINWTIDVSNGTFSDSSDFFAVQNEVFEGQDVDGEVAWQSQPFSISGFNSISIALDAKAAGGFEAGNDVFNIDIVVDGIAENIYTGAVDENDPNKPFLFDGVALSATLQNFTKNISSTGNNAYLLITIDNNATSELIGFDNLLVEGFSSSGNISPLITNISQSPINGNVTSSDPVSVSAEVSDTDGISSVNLNWGTTSGSLLSTINMSVSSGNTYTTTTEIPAQADGTTVYYEIEATDSNTLPATTISLEQNYLVEDPLVLNSQLVQDFDNTTPEWTYSTSIPTFGNPNDFDNDYFGPIDISNASPLDYSDFSNNIFGENDLDNSNGGVAGFAEIIFNEVDISSSSNVVLLFDYDIEGYNAPNDDAS